LRIYVNKTQIFESFRTRKTSLFTAIESKRPVERPEIPGLYCELQDLMIKLPSVMEALDMLALSINRPAESVVLTRLLQICTDVHAELMAWEEGLKEQAKEERLYWSVPSKAHSPADDAAGGPIFPDALQFPSLCIAQLLVFYWSTLIVLYRSIQDIHKRLNRREMDDPPIDPVLKEIDSSARLERWSDHICPSNDRISELAKNICQSLEYCSQTKNGTLGLQSRAFPRWVVHGFYSSQPDRTRELLWCSELDNMTAPDSLFNLHIIDLSENRL
jgi:hypothetical protein